MSCAAQNSYRPYFYSFWLILSTIDILSSPIQAVPTQLFVHMHILGAHVYATFYVAVLKYFEDDLGRLDCDRSLQKSKPSE